MAIGDRITIRGRVRQDGAEPVLAHGSLRVGGGTPIEQRASRRFVVELEDGGRIDVDGAGKPGLPAGNRHEERWGALSTTALARLFRDHAPGDHVEVELTGIVIGGGDAVAITGEVVAERGGEGAGYRDAAAPEPSLLRALVVAIGADPAAAAASLAAAESAAGSDKQDDSARYAAHEAKRAEAARASAEKLARAARAQLAPPMPTWPTAAGVMAAAAAGAAAIAELRGARLWAVAGFAGAIALAVSALAVVIGRSPLPQMRDGKAVRKHRMGAPWQDAATLTALGATAIIITGICGSYFQSRGTALVTLLGAALSALITLIAYLGSRVGTLGKLGLVAGGKTLTVLDDGASGVAHGRAAPGVRLSADISYVHKSKEVDYIETVNNVQRHRTRTNRWIEPHERVNVDELMVIETAMGPLEVVAGGAMWARVPAEIEAGTQNPVVRQLARPGDQVWVLGRVRLQAGRTPRMQKTGPESLLLVVALDDVGAAIAAIKQREWLRFAALGALAALAVVLAVVLL